MLQTTISMLQVLTLFLCCIVLSLLIVAMLVGADRLRRQPKERTVQDIGKLFGGAPIATELGQFMPSGPKAPPGVTMEELQWAREEGATNDTEAATLIAENRRSMNEVKG